MIAIIPAAIVIFSILAYKKWSPIILAPFMACLLYTSPSPRDTR